MLPKIDLVEMKERILYLAGYYNGLAYAEGDGSYSEYAKVYKAIRDDIFWALGEENANAKENSDE